MTARANAQPSGGDGAMERIDDERLAAFYKHALECAAHNQNGVSLYPGTIAALCKDLQDARTRLAAAERVIAAVKFYATDTEFVVDTWHRVEKALAAYDAATNPDTGGDDVVTEIWADVQDDEAGQRITVFAIGEPGCYVANGHIDCNAVMTAVVESGFCIPADEEWDDPRHTWMVAEQGEAEWELFYHEVREGTRDAYPVTLIPVKGYWKEQPS